MPSKQNKQKEVRASEIQIPSDASRATFLV